MKRLIQDFPWMESIYQEIAALRNRPEEVLTMWSDALLQLDENSLKYRVEEMQEELDQAHKDVLKEKAEKEAERAAKEAALARIAELEALLKKQV